MDLGFLGPKMTWTNERKGMANTIECLDRALENTLWRTTFLKASVHTLMRVYSTYNPILISLEGNSYTPSPHTRAFRVEAMWFENPNFENLVNDT